jgi:hypothetical protein
MAPIVDSPSIAFLFIFAVAGFVIGCIVGYTRGDARADAIYRGLETAATALTGGLLARALIWIVLNAAHDKSLAGFIVGWLFFVWPGAIDTVASIFGERLVTTPSLLLWLATTVGAFAGMMDGMWRIHNWKGMGWFTFPVDVTWGLASTGIGCLLHLINFAWGQHGEETRVGAHRYARGFALKPGFAFTQGAVMSNLPDTPGTDLYRHERTHVLQHRLFGPFYVLSYLSWLLVWIVPGMVAGMAVRAGLYQGVEKYCYFNCPWETWGYAVQGQNRTAFGNTPAETRLIWPPAFVILWAIPVFGALVWVIGAVMRSAW